MECIDIIAVCIDSFVMIWLQHYTRYEVTAITEQNYSSNIQMPKMNRKQQK